MTSKPRHNRAWTLAVAKSVAERLKAQSQGTPLQVRIPSRAVITETDGWCAAIGNLGTNGPWLEIWFDYYPAHAQRKLYAGFRAESRSQITSITKRLAHKLWPVHVFTLDDTRDGNGVVLGKPLPRTRFNKPIREDYGEGRTFFGFYDPTNPNANDASPQFISRAVAFFADVAHSLPRAKPESEERQVYPQYENRKRVASHLQRERSHLLAAECKIRDGYRCQVCRLRFEDAYGPLGNEFAEAHHKVPLSKLGAKVRTELDDLITVCANCHRMLHRMDGVATDVATLRRIVSTRQVRHGKR